MDRTIARHVGLIIGDMGLTGQRSPAAAFHKWQDCPEAKDLDAATQARIQTELQAVLATNNIGKPVPLGFRTFEMLSIVNAVVNARHGNAAPRPDAADIDRIATSVLQLCCVQLEPSEFAFLCRSVRNDLALPWFVNVYAVGEVTEPVAAAYSRPLGAVRVATVPEELQIMGQLLVRDHNLLPNEQIRVASEGFPCLTWKAEQ